jgi:hypothetical protein
MRMIRVITIEREFGAGGTAIAEKLAERPRRALVFIRGSYEPSLTLAGLSHFDADSRVAFMHRVIDGAASHPCQLLIHPASSLSLLGPQAHGHSLAKPGRSVELLSTIDQERATFIQKYFGKEWPNRHLYHLMINSKIGDDRVVQAIQHHLT